MNATEPNKTASAQSNSTDGLDGTVLQNECPNCHIEMEGQRIYVDVGRYGTDVWVYICQECAYSDAETS
jgi:hypothetical protein